MRSTIVSSVATLLKFKPSNRGKIRKKTKMASLGLISISLLQIGKAKKSEEER